MNITISEEELEDIKLEYKEYIKRHLKEIFPRTQEATSEQRIKGYITDTFFAYKDGLNFWKSFKDEASLQNICKEIEDYIIKNPKRGKPRENPGKAAKEYLDFMRVFKSFLDERYPDKIYLEFSKAISSSEPNKMKVERSVKQKSKPNIKIPEKIDLNAIYDLIDNVIKVKIGLRVLGKVLIHNVTGEWKQLFPKNQHQILTRKKLDVSVCLSLLDRYWDEIKRILPEGTYLRKVRAHINELKDDRNINAHDGIEDIHNAEARRTLETISLLCDAFGAKEEAEKIYKIRETIPEQNKENPSKNH